ncbi:MAG: tyrosine-type recombinase/integrase [Lachnospiraceae bacterium]|nr:tyrosine-type recombinase/integrase [Lachnospiraceae bacterium]
MRKVNGSRKYVFQSSGSNPINPNHLNARLKELCNELKIRYFSSHKFRFYWISSAYRLGMDEWIIQLIAGHASLEMTRHYNRPTKESEPFSQNEMDLISGYKKPETRENNGF